MPRVANTPCPFRGLFPYSVCQSQGATYPRQDPSPPVTLRPQGFSPSRRLAPLATSWACSIPGALMGFALRGLHPPLTPYALSSAVTLWAYSRGRPTTGLPTGAPTPAEARTPGLGISQVTGPCASLSFSVSRYLATGNPPSLLAPVNPSHAFQTRSQADRLVGDPGA